MAEYPFKDLLPLDEVLEREGYYRDWTHLDPEVFYSLTQISEYVKTKGYGVDVRLLIAQLAEHFGLKTTQMVDLANLLQQKFENLEGVTQSFTNNINSLVAQMEADKNAVIANATVDSEVIIARGGKATLGERLDDTTTQLAQTETTLGNTLYLVDNTMTQNEIQSVLTNYRNVRFLGGVYEVEFLDGKNFIFDIKSHSNILFDDDVIIQLKISGKTQYDIIRINNKENVKIEGLNLIGDRETNTVTGGEWGMGINITASHNVQLSKINVSNCWGDGLYVGSVDDGEGGRKNPSNIHVYDSVFDNNRRQGASIISGNNLRFERCTFSNTQGALPESGIDIEPNYQESIEKIDIIDCVFKGNGTHSITTKVDYDSSLKYLTVRGCQLLDGRNPNMRLHGTGAGVISDVVIENNMFTKRLSLGSDDATNPIKLQRVSVLNNVIPDILVRNISNFVIARNTLGGKPSGGLPSSAIDIIGNASIGKISDNLLEQMGAGIVTRETANTSRIHVTNNDLINSRTGNGIILTQEARDWVITGNTFYDIFDNGIEIDGIRNNASNNTFVTVRNGRAVKLNESSSRNNVNNNITVDISSFFSEPMSDNGTNNKVDVLP